MAEPLVSVIIPAFNAERYIADAVHSALSQSHTNLEVLVVDDGSTDKTVDMVEQIQDSRVALKKCESSGAAAARNTGLRNASGEYIQFLDADDLLGVDKVELQLAKIFEFDPVRTIASCTWQRFVENINDASSRREDVWKVEDPVEWLICSLSGGGMMQTGAWLTHRKLIQGAGPWNETLSLHDDGEFFARVLLEAKRQVFVADAHLYYRTVPQSLSGQRSRAAIESAYRVCQLRDNHLLCRRNDKQARAAIATQYAQFAYEFADLAPDLTDSVVGRIRALRATPFNNIGGQNFRILVKILGFPRALFLRQSFMQI